MADAKVTPLATPSEGFFSEDFKDKLKSTTRTSLQVGLSAAVIIAPIAFVIALAKRVGGGGSN